MNYTMSNTYNVNAWRKTPEWKSTQVRILKALNKPVNEKLESIDDKQIVSAREVWMYCVGKGKPISWIESYKALLRYVSQEYVAIFNPTIKGGASGTRYFVNVNNVVDFLYAFENSEL